MEEFIREAPGVALTVARYGIAERMARKVDQDEPITGDMATFIAADILDGALLRQVDRDTPIRRIADGVVDHLSVARVAREVARHYPESRPYIGMLAVRAAIVGGLNLTHLLRTGEVTKGRLNQETTNLAMAGFALTAVKGNKTATRVAGSIAVGIGAWTAAAHLRDLGKPHTNGIREL